MLDLSRSRTLPSFAVVFVVILVIFGYFPLTVFLGGWDHNSIEHLEKAVLLSGASVLLVKPLTYFILKAKDHAKLHDRFGFNEDDALKDIYYLMNTREINRIEKL